MWISVRNHLTWSTSAALSFSLLAATVGVADNKSQDAADSVKTESPIKHVIILIGENRGTDHTFGVYKPRGKNQTISNLLSKGIVYENGSPGLHFSLAQRFNVARGHRSLRHEHVPVLHVGAVHLGRSLHQRNRDRHRHRRQNRLQRDDLRQ